ncbi:hypothetical protein NFJ02_18g31900 [Pycnococcus provasolii]
MPTPRAHAAHLDTRADHYRGTYWYKALDGNSAKDASKGNTFTGVLTPATPVVGETLRIQKNSILARPPRTAYKTLKDYGSLDALPTGAFKHSLGPLSETSGTVRSLPTQLSDRPTSININHLRSERLELIWKDYYAGSRTFRPGSNVDNWVEERHDAAYHSGTVSERQPTTYESVASKTLKEASRLYTKKKNSSPVVAKVRGVRDDYRSHTYQLLNERRPNYINYSNERADVSAKDPNMSGCYWVGTAPTHMFKSVGSSVYGEKDRLEFQKRSRASDTKSRVLCGIREEHRPALPELNAYRSKWFSKDSRAETAPALATPWRTEYGRAF